LRIQTFKKRGFFVEMESAGVLLSQLGSLSQGLPVFAQILAVHDKLACAEAD
jgi:hypothetical protein